MTYKINISAVQRYYESNTVMTYKYNEPELMKRLEKLPPLLRVRFAYNCTDRLLVKDYKPDYKDSLAILKKALGSVKEELDGNPIDRVILERLLTDCTELSQKYDEVNDIEEVLAATIYTLNCLNKNGDVQEAAWAARRAYEAADYIAQNEVDDINLPGAENKILSTQIVQDELAAQEIDLKKMEESIL